MQTYELIEVYAPEYGDTPVNIRLDDYNPAIHLLPKERELIERDKAQELLEEQARLAAASQNDKQPNTSLPKELSQGLTDSVSDTDAAPDASSSNTGIVGAPTADNAPASTAAGGDAGASETWRDREALPSATAQPEGEGSARTATGETPKTDAKPLSKAERKQAAKLAAQRAASAAVTATTGAGDSAKQTTETAGN